jgi:predicted TPR repeat methyltransferase
MNRHERRVAAKQQKRQSVSPEQALKMAIELHQQQRFAEAEKIYRAILELHARHPDALHYLGVLLHQTGHSEQGIEAIRQALVIAPDYVDALNNLGNVLKEIGDMQGAVDVYQQVLTYAPDHAGVLNNLGVALRHLDAYEESIALLKRALALTPNNADVLQNLGNSYRANGEYQAAIEAYQASLAINPTQKVVYHNFWKLLVSTGQKEAARQVLEQWIAVEPDNHIAQHHYLADTGYMPERASEGYIQQTFDRFAASFDNVLQNLDYRAPSLIILQVGTLFSETQKLRCVLDAGCGTGLSGIGLKPYADKLIGVDLSQGMLTKARVRGIYDELVQADLVAYLTTQTEQFELIISADTLVYFGALLAFLQAARSALTSKGTLIFTLEKQEADNGFALNYHGRYAHTPRYVSDCLNEAGLVLQSMETVILRKEAGEPVVGLLVTATS